jgi:hypothetical protein
MDIVDEITGKCEDKTGNFPLTLTEMVDRILVGCPRFSATDNVQVEDGLRNFPSSLSDVCFSISVPHVQ